VIVESVEKSELLRVWKRSGELLRILFLLKLGCELFKINAMTATMMGE
jgi:hypothetical protein